MGSPQVRALLSLRQDAERIWGQFAVAAENDVDFDRVFGECCGKFNSPELWSMEMFRDELIGDLLKALPHPVLDYDRWLLELDPRERNRRHHFGEPEPVLMPADSPQNRGRRWRLAGRRKLLRSLPPLPQTVRASWILRNQGLRKRTARSQINANDAERKFNRICMVAKTHTAVIAERMRPVRQLIFR